MKLISTILFLLVYNFCFATIYYVKIGGNNTLSGTSDANAWADLTKVNATSFVNGDIIKFRCGDTFTGTITPNTSGVTYASYGLGAKPIFSGLVTISSWVNIGGNIWEAAVTGSPATVNMVIINGAVTAMGRWPNFNTSNAGYKNYTSFVANTSITDPTLTGTPNWVGAELVIRNRDFVTTRTPILTHVTTTLTFASIPGSGIQNNMGYFIQNSLQTLDQQNEWYYNTTTHNIDIYSVGTPPNIQIPTTSSLVSSVNTSGTIKSNLAFRGLSFIGANGVMMALTYNNSLTVDSCDFNYGGVDAVDTRYCPNLTFKNSTIYNMGNEGFREFNTTLTHHTTFTNNTIKRIAQFSGMMSTDNTFYNETERGTALQIGSVAFLAKDNVFDSIGYCAIRLSFGDSQIIRKNRITNFCSVKNDGGAIYSAVRTLGSTIALGIVIDSNIISLSSPLSAAGTANVNNQHVRGIYMDRNSTNIKIQYNSVFSCWEGIYLSASQYISARFNTIFDCGLYQTSPAAYAAAFPLQDAGTGDQHLTHNLITNNVMFSKLTDQLLLYSYDTYYAMDSIGVIDSNRYINTGSQTRIVTYNPTYPNQYFSLPQWRVFRPQYDAHSTATPMATPVLTSSNWASYLRFDYNQSMTPLKVTFTGLRYMDVNGGLHDNADTIGAWSSRGLILVGSIPPPNQPPVANAGANQTITLPTNSTSVTGSATDADGTVVSTQWVKISGPTTGTIATPTTLTSAVNSLVQGTYLLQFSATDNLGAIGRDTMQITVNPAPVNQLPIVSAGVDKNITLPTNTVSVTGTASDPDGSIISVIWAFVSGPATATFGSATSLTTAINSLTVAGTYVISFTATDNSGGSSSDFMQVFVGAANIPPVAHAGNDTTITLPATTATLYGSGTDADGTIVTYAWVKLSGPAGTITSPSSATTGLTGLTIAGNYLFQLTVTDNNGATASDVMQLTVLPVVPPPNIPPTANAGSPVSITLPTNFTVLNGSASIDPDGVIVSYRWSKVSGGVAVIVSPTSAITNVTSMVSGIYQFRLAVIDNLGDSGIATVQVTVQAANIPPLVNAGNDTTIVLPTNIVHLSATVSDLDGIITSVLWTKISGTGGTIVIPNSVSTDVISLTAGTYLFQITAKDNAGDSSSDVVQITVLPQPANVPPTATITGGNQLVLLPSTTTTLSGYGTDTDGYIFSYAWTLVSSPVGSSPIIQTPTAPTTGILNLSYIGDYVFMLTVTDNRGGQGAATVTVSVIQTTADGTIISGKTKYIN